MYLLHSQRDTGLSSFINDVEQHYSGADVVTFSFDHQKARMNKGDIKKKTSSLTIVMQVVMSPFMK